MRQNSFLISQQTKLSARGGFLNRPHVVYLRAPFSRRIARSLDGNGGKKPYKTGGGMPYVNIKITKEGATAEQKAELIKGVTDLLAGILGKNPATTVVTIDEVETDNWGIGGESVTIRRKSKL